jgi:hypothetical protein
MEVEWNDELGPDDFMTEIKITVHLDHGMGRDSDSIQSIFNKGMGRIYDLPNGFRGTSDGQTHVDIATKNNVTIGTLAGGSSGIIGTSGTTNRTTDKSATINNQMHSNVSVWNRSPFQTGVAQNFTPSDDQTEEVFRSQYRQTDWVAQRALS